MTTKTGTSTRTTTRRATTAKTAKPKAAKSTTTRRSAASARQVTPKLVEVKEAVVTKPELRKKELIDLVVEKSGGKKKDAKPAIEAALEVLGEALAEGRELNLRPLGKLKISRVEEKGNGTIIMCRVRQPKATSTEPADTDTVHAAE